MDDSSEHKPITIDGCDTLPKLFRNRVSSLANQVVMREKDLGIWRSYTWKDYGARAMEIGMGLISLGLRPGDKVSIVSDPNKEWLFTDMGVICAGGVSSGVYTTDSAVQLEYLITDSNTRYLFVENEEQLDKALEIRGNTPGLHKIIVYDMSGLRDLVDDDVMSLDELYDRGRIFSQQDPDLWDSRIDNVKPEDLLILIYTSGTTGKAKGAMISNRNILFQMQILPKLFRAERLDEQLSFLPLCHIAERTFSIHIPLTVGSIVNFVEGPDTVFENLQEISPSYFCAVPRIWEKFYSSVSIKVRESTRFGKWAYDQAINVGYQVAERKIEKQPVPAGLAFRRWLAEVLVLRNVKEILGLDRVKWTLTGAAPVSPDLIKWYMALGIDMLEIYGQTESCAVGTLNRPGHFKMGTVGPAVPGCEAKISDQGEILFKGPFVFMGYLNQPEKTTETVVDGWLHTGDVGRIDNEGFVKVTDRMKDIIITAGGKNITPSEWENQLKFSPYVSDAVVIGDKRKYLSCLVMIDQENVEKFAQDKNVPFTNYASLCKAEEVVNLIHDEITRVNKDFARVETIKKFRLINQLLTAEDEELTPTMKLKRGFVSEKYRDLIDSMY